MNRRLWIGAVVVAIGASAASAAILVKFSDTDLVQKSDRIVLGTVLSVTPEWRDPDADGVSQIWTAIEFRVDQVLKGPDQPGQTITFLQMQGKVDGTEYRLSGIPNFAAGEQHLLFLYGDLMNPKYTPLTGMAQGKWNVFPAQDNTLHARRDFSESCFLKRDGDRLVEDAKPSEAEEPLADVLARFQKEVAAEQSASNDQEGGGR